MLSGVYFLPSTQFISCQEHQGFPGGSDGKESARNAESLDWEGPLEKGMATYSSSILAWRIPCTEEPGRLHPCGRKELDMTEQLTLFQEPSGL